MHGLISGQVSKDTVFLNNPSFEDTPKQSSAPQGWTDCGFQGESAPDVHPSGFWEVSKPANNGKTYLGMVVRHNDTWERVSQLLDKPLLGGQCYNFTVYLSSSDKYRSGTNNRDNYPLISRNDTLYNFDIPAVLRIWGGNIACGRSELLAESPPIENSDWRSYSFRLRPKTNYKYIMLEAFFKTPVLVPYNGNILLDNASPLIPVDCDAPVTPPKPATPPVVAKPKQNIPSAKPIPTNPEPPVVFVAKPKVGEIIKINRLFFPADSSNITPENYPVLDSLYNYLRVNNSLVVEVGGHTNSRPGITDQYCDNLSTMRAKNVAEYLIGKGIASDRITFAGYGRRKPIDTNFNAEGRARNQRVELKVLRS